MPPRPYIRVIENVDGSRTLRVRAGYLGRLVREAIEEISEEERGDGPEVSTADSKGGGDGKGPTARRRPAKDADQEVPDAPDPADDEIEADASGGEDPGGKLSNELVGKTVQSITQEPKSKIFPGASELVLTFNEITDPLRVIVSPNGKVRFFFRNSLHNLV